MERIRNDHLEVLKRAGIDGVEHDSHVPFLSHLAGVRRLLAEWKASSDLVDAGLFVRHVNNDGARSLSALLPATGASL